jgi:hypothetical protein
MKSKKGQLHWNQEGVAQRSKQDKLPARGTCTKESSFAQDDRREHAKNSSTRTSCMQSKMHHMENIANISISSAIFYNYFKKCYLGSFCAFLAQIFQHTSFNRGNV